MAVTTALLIGTAVAGAGMTAAGQYRQARSQEAEQAYNRQLALREGRMAEEESRYAVRQQRRLGERLKGRQRALYAKSGVTSEGSPLEVMQETAADLEMDALLTIRQGYLAKQRYGAEADIYKMRGKSIRRALPWQMGSTLLTSGARMGYLLR